MVIVKKLFPVGLKAQNFASTNSLPIPTSRRTARNRNRQQMNDPKNTLITAKDEPKLISLTRNVNVNIAQEVEILYVRLCCHWLHNISHLFIYYFLSIRSSGWHIEDSTLMICNHRTNWDRDKIISCSIINFTKFFVSYIDYICLLVFKIYLLNILVLHCFFRKCSDNFIICITDYLRLA